jgi:hypothetical protein
MARINNFRQELIGLDGVNPSNPVNRSVPSVSHSDLSMGFKVDGTGAAKKTKASRRKARAEDFALLLADDAEKNFDKMIPLTKERVERARALLEGVELD